MTFEKYADELIVALYIYKVSIIDSAKGVNFTFFFQFLPICGQDVTFRIKVPFSLFDLLAEPVKMSYQPYDKLENLLIMVVPLLFKGQK